MPMPLSVTSSVAVVPSASTRSSTRPPGGVNLSAFEIRLSTTWVSRERSAVTSGDAYSTTSKAIFRSSASG